MGLHCPLLSLTVLCILWCRPHNTSRDCWEWLTSHKCHGWGGKMLPWTVLEDQFPVPRNTAASKIGDGVISLLWQLRCHCNPDHNKVSSLSSTTVVAIFRNLCLSRRHAQTWEVLTLKNPIEPPKVHHFSLSLHLVTTNMAKFKYLFFKQYKAWFSFSYLYFLQCWLRDQTGVQRPQIYKKLNFRPVDLTICTTDEKGGWGRGEAFRSL